MGKNAVGYPALRPLRPNSLSIHEVSETLCK